MKYNLNVAVGDIVRGRSITASLLSDNGGKFGSFMQGLTVAKESADVYITDIDNGDSMQLSYVPEQISAMEAARFQSYNIIENGEVKVPKGTNLTKISWDGILPGEAMLNYSYIKFAAWEEPETIISRWNKWKEKGSRLNLMITQTAINLQVYLDSFSPKSKGSLGNIEYSISFVQAKDLFMRTVVEVNSENANTQADALKERPPMKKPQSVTIKPESTLWTIAQQFTGNGGNWQDILAYNVGRLAGVEMATPGTRIILT